MLKGATLFVLWEEEPHRPTRDIDLLGFGEDSAERMHGVFAEVCRQEVEEDGVVFAADTVTVSDIREGQTYQGKRAHIRGRLGAVKLRVQVDVGFGDAVVGREGEVVLPPLLDFPAPRLHAYPVEAVVSEKLHAMVQDGLLNSRMKDIFDVMALSQRLPFDGLALTEAVRGTFGRRRVQPSVASVASLSSAFVADKALQARWAAFLARNRLGTLTLEEACEGLRRFLEEPLRGLKRDEAFVRVRPPGGPWQDPAGA